jgi:hypothetical protein
MKNKNRPIIAGRGSQGFASAGDCLAPAGNDGLRMHLGSNQLLRLLQKLGGEH